MAALTVSAACTSSNLASAPSPEKCQVTLTSRGSVSASGGIATVVVAAQPECAWSVTADASWITEIKPTSGHGDGQIDVAVAPNVAPTPRQSTVRVNSAAAAISQEAASSCQYGLSATTRAMSAAGGTTSIDVTTIDGCTWTATSNVPWLTVGTPSASGSGSVVVQVAANNGAARAGTITVANQTVTINQAGGSGTPPPPTGACSYAINPLSQAFVAAGGTGGPVSVTTTPTCAWTATTTASWIAITSGANGMGNGTVSFTVAPNSGSARSDMLTIAGQTFTVDQAAATMPCSYAIAPTSQSIGASGGPGSPIAVTTSANCTWTATSNASWITITSAASGIGNGSITFSVAANGGPARSGTLTVESQTFTVNQDATVSCTYAISPTSLSIGAAGGAGTTTMTTLAGCAWTATSNATWITVTSGASGSGPGTVSFDVAAHSGVARSGTLTVGGQTFTVDQAAACSYAISPTNETFSETGGNGLITVTAPAGCSWTAVSNDAWVTIVSGASGSGTGAVGFLVAPNSGNRNRTATLTVAGQLFTVTQHKH